MLRRYWFWVALFGLCSLCLPARATEKPASLSGYVRDTAGVPQMGAMVEVLSAAAREFRIFTDDRGFYRLNDLIPGTYSVKVTAPSFLPALRESIGLRGGSTAIVNITLRTIFDALDLGPPRTSGDDDDWKWTLRSVASRPVLRVLPDGTGVVVSRAEKGDGHELKASLSLLAGSPSEGYGSSSDMATGFALEHQVFSTDTWMLAGNVGYGEGLPSAVLRTAYTHHGANGSAPTIAVTVRQLAPPEVNLHTAGLQAMALTTTDNLNVGDVLELRFGSELQTIQFMGRVNSFRPFGTVDLHLTPDTVVEYAYTSSRPGSKMAAEENMDGAELGTDNPRVSIASFSPALEQASHQEVSVSHRIGNTNLQVAMFSDRVSNTVLTGVGEVSAGSGELLPDLASGSFSYRGKELDTQGLRLVLQRKLRSDLTATLDYGYGGVLELGRPDMELRDARGSLLAVRRHAVSGRLSGRVRPAKTQWSASYGWVNGQALTPVDMFNASPGQSDPYLNVYLRQPLPEVGFFPVHMEAMVDLRNLLAQGYVPVMGQDGHTVYLVQSARSVRGGLAFTF